MLLNIIKEIRYALEKESYLSALSLALTIPDICGKVYRPDLQSEKGDVEKRYAIWYDDHIYKYDHAPDFRKVNYLNGYLMYGLRTAFLHDGAIDINEGILSAIKKSKKEKNKNNEKFNNIDSEIRSIKLTLKYPDKKTFGVSRIGYSDLDSEGKIDMEIDIAQIIQHLIWTAEEFYEKHKETFEEIEANKNWIIKYRI